MMYWSLPMSMRLRQSHLQSELVGEKQLGTSFFKLSNQIVELAFLQAHL